ncbi:MAG: mechanosensitive ion channel family protein [Betaproteobacteria bacterium]
MRAQSLACLMAASCALAPLASLGADEPATGGPPPKVETPIAVESSASADARIKSRIEKLYATQDGLSGVNVDVRAGVVVLSGEVPSNAVHTQAANLARRVESVVDVRDGIVESRDVRTRMSQMLDRVVAQFVNFVGYLPLLLVAAAELALFWWIGKRVAGSPRITRRFAGNPFLRDLAKQGVRVGFVAVGLLIALEVLDASTLVGSVLGAAGVLGLAVGFALRDTVENYIASLLLSLRQPFARDDLVDIEGCEGRVLRLTSRATILMTLDGNHTRIPNAKVYKAVIVNYTRNPKRRFQFDVGVDTEQNLAAAQNLASTTVARMEGVLRDPPPVCTVEQLGDSNVVLRVFGWMDQTQADFQKVRSEAIRMVKGAFDRAGVVMPEPIYNVRIGQGPSISATATGSTPAPDPGAPPSPRKPAQSQSAEPLRAIDIAPTDDLDRQIAADRRTDEDDLLRQQAPKE